MDCDDTGYMGERFVERNKDGYYNGHYNDTRSSR